MPKTVSPSPLLPAPKPATGPVALLVGTRKGAFVLRGDKARKNWKQSEGLFIGNVIYHIVMDPRDQKTILMANRTGHLGPTIYRSTDVGKTWKEVSRPPAFPKAPEGKKGEAVHHVFWLSPGHLSEPGVWYAGCSPPALFRSEDHGLTWDGVPGFNEHPMRSTWCGGLEDGPPGGATLHSIEIDPRDSSHMYISLSGGGVFESTDKGADWKPLNRGVLSDFMPDPKAEYEYGQDPHCTRMHPLLPDRLYQQNHCGVYRMDRAAARWERIGTNLPKKISDYGFPLVLHPRDPETAWLFPLDGGFPLGRVSQDGKPATYVTHNGGKSWKRQDKGLPRSGGWFSVKRQGMTADHHDPAGLYFGTTNGEVWASRDEGNSWACIATELPEIYSVEAAELPR